MSRHSLMALIGGLAAAAALCGCRPQQPFFFFEDGDLSHYIGVATEIEYPDAEFPTSAEVEGAKRPFSLANQKADETWDLTLQEAVQIALANNKVIRNVGGQVQGPPDFIARNPELVPTIYDPAIAESDPRSGVEAALSAFDAQLSTTVFWEKNDIARNSISIPGGDPALRAAFPTFLSQDTGNFQAQLRKTTATGGTFTARHGVAYDAQNTARIFPSDWNVNLDAEFRQPLLQGAGVQFNRIVGPNGELGAFNGVMLARIRTDIALADFEQAVRDLVSEVENQYWELYFAYRALNTLVAGRDSGLQTWRQVWEKFKAGAAPVVEEAQARQQYFQFRSAMEQALTSLYQTEARLRYLMGLSSTDGRLIRPADEPTHAKVSFDWNEIHAEALCRYPEIREQRWLVKRRELELIGSRNFLLPRLDAVGRYRWLGLGDDLLSTNAKDDIFDNAYENLTTGKFFSWQVGLEFSVPLGKRREMAGVRNAELALARERARLQELELELSHQLGFALREVDSALVLTQTNFNRRVAARDEVQAAIAKYEAQARDGTLTNVLDAQRRLAEAEGEYYRSLVDYNKAITQVHYRKGSLLEYNGVYLAEGPWPAKAYFDATRRARARDASLYLDYGFTMPKVVSRGPIEQHAGQQAIFPMEVPMGEPTPATPETVPAPQPEPLQSGEKLFEPDLFEPSAPMPERRAAGEAGGPLVIPATGWAVAKPGTKRNYDLATLNLAPLAGKPAGTAGSRNATSPAVARSAAMPAATVRLDLAGPQPSGAVRAANYEEPVAAGVRSATASTQGRVQWTSPKAGPSAKKPASIDESLASPATAASDRPSSGWKRVQH
ncbi:MAG: TolC family protein [Planctomycetota bacterium]